MSYKSDANFFLFRFYFLFSLLKRFIIKFYLVLRINKEISFPEEREDVGGRQTEIMSDRKRELDMVIENRSEREMMKVCEIFIIFLHELSLIILALTM